MIHINHRPSGNTEVSYCLSLWYSHLDHSICHILPHISDVNTWPLTLNMFYEGSREISCNLFKFQFYSCMLPSINKSILLFTFWLLVVATYGQIHVHSCSCKLSVTTHQHSYLSFGICLWPLLTSLHLHTYIIL